MTIARAENVPEPDIAFDVCQRQMTKQLIPNALCVVTAWGEQIEVSSNRCNIEHT